MARKDAGKKIPPPKIRPPGRSDDRAETPGGGLPDFGNNARTLAETELRYIDADQEDMALWF
jgi:hypothetical protein